MPTDNDAKAEARRIAALVLQGSGYWLEESPEHISEGVTDYLVQVLAAAREQERVRCAAAVNAIEDSGRHSTDADIGKSMGLALAEQAIRALPKDPR